MVDLAAVGIAEDKFLFFHLARANNAAPTQAATAPIAAVTSTITYSSLGYLAEEVAEDDVLGVLMGGLMVGILVE